MSDLSNCGYVAGQADEAVDEPFGVTLLDQLLVVFRTESGDRGQHPTA